MKKILQEIFSSSSTSRSNTPSPEAQIPPQTLPQPPLYSFQMTTNIVIQKGPCQAGPQTNIAGVSLWR
jgi:hypothetical protein